jgi:hypothetical protein
MIKIHTPTTAFGNVFLMLWLGGGYFAIAVMANTILNKLWPHFAKSRSHSHDRDRHALSTNRAKWNGCNLSICTIFVNI